MSVYDGVHRYRYRYRYIFTSFHRNTLLKDYFLFVATHNVSKRLKSGTSPYLRVRRPGVNPTKICFYLFYIYG